MASICDSCGQNPAGISFKAEIEGRHVKMNLCEECARQKGILGGWGGGAFAQDLTQLLSTLAHNLQEDLAKSFKIPSKPPSGRCARCGTTFAHFKSTSFVGCAECYESFSPSMKEVIRRIHGTAAHRGKPYAGARLSGEYAKGEIAKLRKELEAALAKEAYEHAAYLRDQIRSLEGRR